MTSEQSNNPLHGLTLESVVVQLFEHYGWDGLASRISVNCFKSDPSVKSSLKFLRKTPWAREQVEKLYVSTFPTATPTPASLSSDAPSARSPWSTRARSR